MLDHYLHTAYAADRLLNPTRDPIVLAPARPGATPEHPTDVRQALEWFGAEHAVLLAAVDQAAASGLDTHAWQLAWALADYLDRHGHWHDQAAIQSAAVAAADRLSDPAAQAVTNRTLAIAYIRLRRPDDAEAHLQRALQHADDIAGRAHIQHVLATVHASTKRYTVALHHIRQAADLYTAAGHRPALASALNSTGWYHAQLGNHREALGYCQQALDLFRTLADLDGQAATWDSLGYIQRHLGRHTEAVTCYQRAVDLYREVSAYYHQADTLASLGDTHDTAGDHTAARAAWHQALRILDDLQHPDAAQLRTKLHQLDA
jgi:tetratricopeptide (TPR) repeat protein